MHSSDCKTTGNSSLCSFIFPWGAVAEALCYACSQGLLVLDVSALLGASASVVRGACFGSLMGT